MKGYPELSERELRDSLGRIAAEHQPDRTAMLTRIARHRPGSPVRGRRPAGQALRLAGSALAVATILGVGATARWALADGPEPAVPVIAPPAATRPVPSAAPATTTPAPAPSGVARPPAEESRARRSPPRSPADRSPAAPERELLWADGSVDPNTDDTEGRSDITLKVREPLRALRLTVRLAPTAGLSDRGVTLADRGPQVATTVVREQESLVYRFELAGDATLDPGTYVFTVRYAYDNEGGRDAGRDTYSVAATADDGSERELDGDFY